MNHEQAFEAARQANPLPAKSAGPDGFLSMTALLDRIDERSSDMQTQERPTTDLPEPRRPQRPRWLIPALASAAAVFLAIVAAVALFTGDDEPDVTNDAPVPTTAGEVGEALNTAAAAGDWETVVGLFAEDATITLGPGNGVQFLGSSFPRGGVTGSGPANPTAIGDFLTGTDWPGSFTVVNWDGDSVRNGFDSLAQDTMVGYALGFSVFDSCRAEDPSTLVCVGVWDGHPFPTSRGEEVAIHTVSDGVITDTTWDISGVRRDNIKVIDPFAVAEYEAWVRANRSEFTADPQLFRSNPGDVVTPVVLVISQDTVEIHRQLIAEWMAQR